MAAIRRKPSAEKRKSESKARKGSAQKPQETSFKKVSYNELSTRRLRSTKDAKFLCKLDRLKRLAAWASGEASIPSLGAYLGHLYSASAETMAAEPDLSIVSCGRCETILHPGKNCTVRVEKNQAKRKHNYKNNVVYRCDFCSHASQKRGAPSSYYKREVSAAKEKPPSGSQPSKSNINKSCRGKTRASRDSKKPNVNKIILLATPGDMAIDNSPANPSLAGATRLLGSTMRNDDKVTLVNGIALPATAGYVPIANGPANPSVAGNTPFLDAMKRKRKRSQSKVRQTPQSNSAATNVEGNANSSVRKKRKQPKTMWEGLKNKFDQIDRQRKQNTLNLGQGSGKPFLF